MGERLVANFEDAGLDAIAEVGGKNASLGEMIRALAPRGVLIPPGFSLTAAAYRLFMRQNGLDRRVREALAGLDPAKTADLQARGRALREAVLAAPLPAALEREVLTAYARLDPERHGVAARSSATAEDLPEASFAGQQESFLNVASGADLLDCVRRCYASLFNDRAISYRAGRGYSHEAVALSVGVQRMVRSDLACAGVAFTLDPETGFRGVVLVSAAWGLGESVVQGVVQPDEYLVFKPALKEGYRPLLRRRLGSKEVRLVYDAGGGRRVRSEAVPAAERARFALGDEDVLTLARWACLVEDHYGARAGQERPMDLEWAKDGRDGRLYLLQARPETVQSRKAAGVLETFRLGGRGPVLVSGRSVGDRVGAGRARVLKGPAELARFQPGEVLVAEKTDPDWEPVMRKAAAIVTERGGRTCHAAIVSRELGLPAVVGAAGATKILADGREVTVSCAEGETGRVYDGRLPFTVERTDLKGLAVPRTKIMLNVADPERAFGLSFLPNAGVGLARMEFIVTDWVKVHPLALLHPERVADAAMRARVEELRAAGGEDPGEWFVDKLAQGIAVIAAAFHPKPVILRLSDFKTNEYAHLLGGEAFEPAEENPMLGFRGASRYAHPAYREGFALECRAVKRAREVMGLWNLKLMVPFCRTVEEGKAVLAELARHGLRRGEAGLEVLVMCEIPSNAILAEDFAEIFDGFSIGSNDLTQLVLGVDRDSEIVAPVFDERNEAVRRVIDMAIRGAHAKGRPIGICGQAPSDYPDFARWLVERGIDSLSLNPDAALKTTLLVLEAEKALATRTTPRDALRAR